MPLQRPEGHLQVLNRRDRKDHARATMRVAQLTRDVPFAQPWVIIAVAVRDVVQNGVDVFDVQH